MTPPQSIREAHGTDKEGDSHRRLSMLGAVRADPTPLEPLLNIDQVAALLGLSTKTVRAHIREGELPSIRVVGRVRLAPADLRAYVAGHRTVGAA
jgi:excisionase family DNA binding protein